LSAPVREFPKATDLPLTIDYFFYPVLFSIFYVKKRERGRPWSRISYFFVWISVITLLDVVRERYTGLLEYKLLTWYGMW
ncbi:CBO0543 family protein, partial [Alkalibacillus haloalkaliphilus]|uniref:CBO0543 family protein n=1 Tax=Alkalibacillus haloalkaliphilus TaxID=94136 RepID=UPI0029362D29